MQADQLIWETISKEFCSFKVKTTTQLFCRNVYNVTGLCSRQSCPLANSRYATVREHKGIIYLYVKTIERAHSPANMWEKIQLSKNYKTALEQIDAELIYWPEFMLHKCKQRLTKITQYLIRMRKLRLKTFPKLIGINKKIDRREAKKEAKAEAAARLETAIEKELLDRLRKGIYGTDGIINDSQTAFSKALDEIEEQHEQDEDFDDADMEEEEEDFLDRAFVSDISDSDEDDLEDLNPNFNNDSDDASDMGSIDSDDSSMQQDDDDDENSDDQQDNAKPGPNGFSGKKRGSGPTKPMPAKKQRKRGARVEIEYEHEHDQAQLQR